MKLEEVQFKLLSEIQSLPPELALEFCNKALREIYDEHDWSFLYKKDFIRTPKIITSGSLNATKFSDELVIDATLKAQLDALTISDVPIIGRQVRVFGGQIAGSNFIYNIKNYDSSNSKLKIEPYFQDASISGARFQIFKNLYNAPELVERDSDNNILFQGIDFESFEFILAPFSQRRLWLDLNRRELDKKDVDRVSLGDPFYVVSSDFDSLGNQLFELYPIPINERVYQVLYKKSGRNLEPEESIPASLSYGLILAKAKIKAYEWLMINGDKVGDRKSPNVYLNLIGMISNPSMENSYIRLLEKAKMKDENLYPQALIDLGSSWPYYQDVIVETILLDF